MNFCALTTHENVHLNCLFFSKCSIYSTYDFIYEVAQWVYACFISERLQVQVHLVTLYLAALSELL